MRNFAAHRTSCCATLIKVFEMHVKNGYPFLLKPSDPLVALLTVEICFQFYPHFLWATLTSSPVCCYEAFWASVDATIILSESWSRDITFSAVTGKPTTSEAYGKSSDFDLTIPIERHFSYTS